MVTYIDGYNLLHAAGVFPARHLQGPLHYAREALLEALVRMLSERELAQTMIVFDSAEAPPGLPDRINFQGLDVRFAANHADADEMIEVLIDDCRAPRELVVVSSDHRIQRAARRRKAVPIDSDVWFRELSAKQQTIELERTTAKPQEPLTEGEVDFWLKAFETDPKEARRRVAGESQPPADSKEKRSQESDAAEQVEPDAEQARSAARQTGPAAKRRLPEDRLESGPYNPFPPGYADDLFEEE